MNPNLTTSIVRIIKQSGSTAGTGFLVTDEGLIATCVHVMEYAGAGPGSRVQVALHTDDTSLEAEILLDGWHPEADVAFLRLVGPLPEDITPAVLVPSAGWAGTSIRVFGYPDLGEIRGLWGEGKLLNFVDKGKGKQLQIECSQITLGFSGGPVWDVKTGQVIGMIVEVAAPDHLTRLRNVAFAVPTETLRDLRPTEIVLSKLKVVSRLQDFLDDAVQEHRYRSLTWGTKIAGDDLSLPTVYIKQELYSERPGDPLEHGLRSPADTVSITEVLHQYRHLMILGEPGSGKSTLLHHLALQLAESCTIAPDGSVSGRLPIFLSLCDVEDWDQEQAPGQFPEHLLNHIIYQNPDLPRDDLQELMEQGKIAFFLDALDEVGNRYQRDSMVQGIQRLAGSALGARCLIAATSRREPYRKNGVALERPFQTFTLATLDHSAQKQFVKHWLTVLMRARGESEDWLNLLVETLEQELEQRRALRQTLSLFSAP